MIIREDDFQYFKNLFIGFLLGIFFCVSTFELIHKTIEVDMVGESFCSSIYDKLIGKWEPEILYTFRITYKFFAWPMKTVWVHFSDDKIAHRDEFEEGFKFLEMK